MPMYTKLLNYPVGMDLYPIEPLNGLFVTLIGWVDIVTAANLAALLNLTLTGFVGALFGRALSGTRWGGMAAGTMFQGSAFAAFTIHVGVGELQHLWFLPLGMWMWLRLRRSFRWRDAVILGLTLAAATLSCFYLGFFLALTVSVMSLTTIDASRHTPKLLGTYALAAALALALILPITRTFADSYKAGDPPTVSLTEWVLGEHGQPITDPPRARLEPQELVVPRRAAREGAAEQVVGYGGGRYLGPVALLILLAALVLAPRKVTPWLLVALVGVTFAGGSLFALDGHNVALESGQRIRLPFFHLNRLLGYVGEPINFPIRFLSMTVLALSAAAAVLAGRLSRHRWLVWAATILVTGDVAYNRLNGPPLATFEPDPYPELAELADGPLIDLAVTFRPDTRTRRASLSAQMIHGQNVPGVPLERIEYFARDGHVFVMATPLMNALQKTYQENVHLDLKGVEAVFAEDLAILYDAGLRYFLVLGIGPRQNLPEGLSAALRELLGEPSLSSPRVEVFDIPDPGLSEQEYVLLRAIHARRVETRRRIDREMGRQLPAQP